MKEVIQQAIEVLRKGGIILYPTDTVWGIGCDATNAVAVQKVYALKQNADKQSMLVLVNHVDMIGKYVTKAPGIAWDLLEVSDKPLTIIYPTSCNLAEGLAADDGSIGIRVVKHEFCEQLIRTFGRPLVSTSANLSGRATPQSYSEISKEILGGVDFIIPSKYAGKMTNKPSSIIKLGENGEVKVIRN